MLANHSSFGKILTKNLEKNSRFCQRSGFISFEPDDLANVTGIGTIESLGPDQMIPINPEPVDCMRLYFRELQGYSIPQLALYGPKCGYPLCDGDKNAVYRRSGKWPDRYKQYFVEIPTFHIGHGMYSSQPLHQYSVHLSDPVGHYKKQELHPFKKESFEKRKEYLSTGRYPFNTDKNNVRVEDLHKDMFPADFIVHYNMDHLNNFDHECCFATTSPAQLRTLNNHEFQLYLAWWFLYYPHKWITTKDPRASECGSAEEPFNGYTNYYVDHRNGDFFGSAPLLTRYYNSKKPMRIGPTLVRPKFTGFVNDFHWKTARLVSAREEYDVNDGIKQYPFKAMAMIRAAIGNNKEFMKYYSFYPFRRRKQAHSVLHKTFITKKGLTAFNRIVQIREHLELVSKGVTVPDHKCVKCNQDLILPVMLVENQVDYTKTVCLSCGYKYLMNLYNAYYPGNGFGGSNWIYFKDYPLTEVMKIEEVGVMPHGANEPIIYKAPEPTPVASPVEEEQVTPG